MRMFLMFGDMRFPFLMIRRPPRSTLFPTRRSSDLSSKEEAYIREVFLFVTDNIDAIDAELNAKMKGWTIDSIPKVDLAILRLAVAEICYAKDIPKVVAVNEAVRIAKKFKIGRAHV